MKIKTVSLLAGVSVPLILASTASGEVLGLTTVKKFVDPADIAADTSLGGLITSLMVVNVYVQFTPGDANAWVNGVGGSAAFGIFLEINTRDGTFFQHPLGNAGHHSPSAGLVNIPGFNTLQHDSFVTIGRKLDNDPIFGADQTGIIGLDTWTDTRLTGSDEVDWFLAGFPPQGDAGGGPDNPPDQVLIGQFTVANPGPNAGVFGEMFINFQHTNAAGVVEIITLPVTFDNQEPDEACCFDDGTCQDLTADDCAAAGGTAQGPGTFCLGDIDGDGVDDACPSADCSGFPCGNNDKKVMLCHVPPGNPANAHTLCISPNAVDAHLENHEGDHCGPCGGIPGDLNGDAAVGVADLMILLGNWE